MVDVRSEKEYAEFHIPGAISFPVLSNEERRIVGTLYKEGHFREAKQRALSFVAPKLSQLEAIFGEEGKNTCIYCARGGYRSRAVAALFYALGYGVYQMAGGIKAYRQMVNRELPKLLESLSLLILYGQTGTGKTDLLLRLEGMGIPVLDLEGMANHKGSVLGSLGLGEPHSQKMFEALLYETLSSYEKLPLFITEGESKRIGKVILPNGLWEAMERSKRIYITSPMDLRAERLMHGYAEDVSLEEQKAAVHRLAPYVSKDDLNEILQYMENGQFKMAAKRICEVHYDKHYKYRPEDDTPVLENIDDDLTAKEIAKFWNTYKEDRE